MKLAICDDDTNALEDIRGMIESYIETHEELFCSIQLFTNAFDVLDWVENKGGFDLYILDIIMEGMTGIELVRELRHRNENMQIIFLTYSTQFAIDAFELNAVHYIVKPATLPRISQALDRALDVGLGLDGQFRSKRRFIIRKTENGMERIDLENICFCESRGRMIEIVLKNGSKVNIVGKISDLYKELSETSQFIMPHRSYIINMESIKQISENEIVTHQQVKIPLPRRRSKEITNSYLQYVFGREVKTVN